MHLHEFSLALWKIANPIISDSLIVWRSPRNLKTLTDWWNNTTYRFSSRFHISNANIIRLKLMTYVMIKSHQELDRRQIECSSWTSWSHNIYIKNLRCKVRINYSLDHDSFIINCNDEIAYIHIHMVKLLFWADNEMPYILNPTGNSFWQSHR